MTKNKMRKIILRKRPMRKTVKRLLKKYDYPPDEMKSALDKVIAQCELWVDEVA